MCVKYGSVEQRAKMFEQFKGEICDKESIKG